MLKVENLFIKVSIFFCLTFFLILSTWWFLIFNSGLTEGFENNAFTLIYPFMSLMGGLLGLLIANRWGGYKSSFGSSLLFFSFGLLAQFFGQAAYAYFIYIGSI